MLLLPSMLAKPFGTTTCWAADANRVARVNINTRSWMGLFIRDGEFNGFYAICIGLLMSTLSCVGVLRFALICEQAFASSATAHRAMGHACNRQDFSSVRMGPGQCGKSVVCHHDAI